MTPNIIWAGEPAGVLAAVPGILGGTRAVTAPACEAGHAQADILLNLIQEAEAAISAASGFAAQPGASGQDRLIVTVIRQTRAGDWDGARQAALLWAFTRHAALAWAPRRIRVNAVGLGIAPALPAQPSEQSALAAGPAPAHQPTPADIAGTIMAMWRWPSMTGQLIRLGQVGTNP